MKGTQCEQVMLQGVLAHIRRRGVTYHPSLCLKPIQTDCVHEGVELLVDVLGVFRQARQSQLRITKGSAYVSCFAYCASHFVPWYDCILMYFEHILLEPTKATPSL